ncbi:MAG: ABC transporter permease [Egibacteraceae bacterium]
MTRRAAEHLGRYLAVLWMALTLNFALPRIAPGSPLTYLFGDEVNALTPQRQVEILRQFRLDQPVLVQYARYWGDVVRLDLGTSVRFGQPVVEVLRERLGWTLLLICAATALITLDAVTAGTVAAWRRGSARDSGLMVGILTTEAMPSFWIGLVLIAVFSAQLGWFPTFGAVSLVGGGGVADIAHHLVLPVITLTLAETGSLFLLMRGSLLTTLGEDYMLMAEAKGASQRRIVFRHGLRNALLPVWTSVALDLGRRVSGVVVVETVFAYPGMGRAIYESVLARDYPLLQGAFLVATLGILVANLVADLTYPLLDPRVRRPRGGRRRAGADEARRTAA